MLIIEKDYIQLLAKQLTSQLSLSDLRALEEIDSLLFNNHLFDEHWIHHPITAENNRQLLNSI
ncbi:hypothetical protein [Thalassotalea sp. PS06]|uniref:hypothetical protein n=1 Tax=Thalassotalea sp. PS06 TaxID=2594005 RepID=UPI0011635F81|nr:hypothetical protein [Thalassotalea sp. PS06]QDP01816.1 hypothetical protein FNC98_10970 [Thalassotalea sp. PS06]